MPATKTKAKPSPKPADQSDAGRAILVRGARTHNLKNITLAIPQGKFTVITGPSGSGKSSLAFDTLYAEGQRRYLESLTPYARQFFERIEKPDVDAIEHIQPAIALEQKNRIKNARSTVGTATEVDDYLRLLFAGIGVLTCPACGIAVQQETTESLTQRVLGLPEGSKILILAPLTQQPPERLLTLGYDRYWEAGELHEVRELADKTTPRDVAVLVDRLVVREGKQEAIRDSVAHALRLAEGKFWLVVLPEDKAKQAPEPQPFQTGYVCQGCLMGYDKPTPERFSFNHPQGACLRCEGFGRVIGLDLNKVIPNPGVSLKDGAVQPFTTPSNQELWDDLLREAKKRKIRVDVPWADLTAAEQAFVLEGGGRYEGVYGYFEWLESKKYKVHVRVQLARYRAYRECPDCHGSRLKPYASWVTLHKRTFWELQQEPLAKLLTWLNGQHWTKKEQHVGETLLRELCHRLGYLNQVGLGYLTLCRQSRTLSGGESQRVNLSVALGSPLTDTLYVLDEPTVGLHTRDTERLINVLHRLRDYGNTVVVVEHDPAVIQAADRVVDIGPAAGEHGGRVVFAGTVTELLKDSDTLTAQYMRHEIAPQPARHQLISEKDTDWFEIIGARGHNLKNLTVRFPKNRLVCVTGVSGSGKSTLIEDTLYTGYQQLHGRELERERADFDALAGLSDFADVVLIDQSPLGRSARSNPVTYTKAWDDIRSLFAATREARAQGLGTGFFSFNVAGGRCEACEGLGIQTIDMQFLADVTITCPECKGRRFKPVVLGIRWQGKSIVDVLEMTVAEAMTFFKSVPKLITKLTPLMSLGLGYLRLGQSTATLSGGEAQRLKLATYLQQEKTARPVLFLFDEPTTGLHLSDVETLLEAFRALLAKGHSLVAIEHHEGFIRAADYLIELGPEGGEGGGKLVVERVQA